MMMDRRAFLERLLAVTIALVAPLPQIVGPIEDVPSRLPVLPWRKLKRPVNADGVIDASRMLDAIYKNLQAGSYYVTTRRTDAVADAVSFEVR